MLASVLPKAVLSPVKIAALHRPDAALFLGLQQVRWKKVKGMKPRWMPMAPSKLFKINLGPPADPEEITVLRRLHAAYKTEMKAIRMERDKLEEARRVEELLQREANAKAKVAQLKAEVEEIVRLEKVRAFAMERQHSKFLAFSPA
ncbi:hypothetical protein HPB50_021376 [Hyalomma asiaticum]|uniref:Uncharacterized protein n=1 Tax=Hyalomma asiaticum TaxID=266040 RepID=A0ACB7T0A6_HYAAI|nr:hypothetical protein HPB50_021376 [Hyalomma asiaticum]